MLLKYQLQIIEDNNNFALGEIEAEKECYKFKKTTC